MVKKHLLRGRWLFAAGILIFGISAVQAAGPYLHGFDAMPLLPPPPALHSPEDVADREMAYQIYSARTPEEFAVAKADTKVALSEFASALGVADPEKLYPKLNALLVDVEAETSKVVTVAKNHWRRLRPNVAEPARFSDPVEPEKNASYPSSHSTRGTVFALVLAEVFPDRRDAILAKGREYGWARVVGGVHTPLDIYAGRFLGYELAQAFLHDPAFQQDLAAAEAEVAAANGR
jgi:acid phosphatase (class A)